jgi:hypothetical protein
MDFSSAKTEKWEGRRTQATHDLSFDEDFAPSQARLGRFSRRPI